MDFPRCRRQSVIESFGAMCDDSAAARRSSKERTRATLRTGSECQRSSALFEHGELLGASREVSREMSEPLVPSSPVASASRKSVSKESEDLPQSTSLWNSCSGAVLSSARQGRQSPPQRCISAIEQPAENAEPLQSASLSQLVVSSAGSQTVAASGDMPSQWNEVPDDILRTVFSHMPSAYVRVARLVCKGWALAAGRLMHSLKPEHLDGPRLAGRFPQLRSLDLSHCLHTVAFHTRTALQLQSNVTDDLVGDLATLNYLRDMSLRGCTALTGAPDTRFARLTMLTQLRCLDISNCTGLKDSTMDVIVELSRLEQLRAFGCTALTDTALIKLSQHPALKSIELGCNSHFSNRGIAALANLQSVERLHLISLSKITNEGILPLRRLSELKHMMLARCPNVCETGLPEAFPGRQLRVFMCGTPLRRSMCAWMSSVLADLDMLLEH